MFWTLRNCTTVDDKGIINHVPPGAGVFIDKTSSTKRLKVFQSDDPAEQKEQEDEIGSWKEERWTVSGLREELWTRINNIYLTGKQSRP